jgi:hypothetical protein
MPRSIRTVILVLTVALLPLATSAFAQTKKEPPPDYFPLRANDWWKYRSTTGAGQQSEFTMKVANVEKTPDGTRYLVNIESSWPIQEWYSKPDGWVVWHKENFQKQNMEVSFSPARQYLKNPLTAGATWSWKGKGMMGVDIDESSTVSGPEPVVVPAGKFTAMKVTTRMTQGGTPVTKTYWYANWVGLVKSMTDTGSVQSTTELVDYSFKKP